MAYQIIIESPTYCAITDGLIGSHFSRLPHAYETKACAHAIAARLERANYEGCGDDRFLVIAWGDSVFKTLQRTMPDCEIPF